ncbi:AraC family transcriptional regulator, partial [Salmonella enterica]|nr:AraC family transcriptional regulator [Salmonella enterica]EBN8191071.1 AraC family transcriptional regulator [Salmonella enterica]
MKKWRVMNREAICLQLADKINHLKNNDKIISERLAGIRLLYGVEPGPRTPVMYQPG